jgi:hypothetical protein
VLEKGLAGKPAQAIAAAEKRYRELAASKGASHIDTLLARRDLGQLCLAAPGRFDEGEAMLVEIVQALRGRPVEDEARQATLALLRDCLERRRRIDKEGRETLSTQAAVGGELLSQKKDAQGQRLLLAACKGLLARQTTLPAAGKERLRQALQDLVRLYEARGKRDEAAKWRKQLQAFHNAEKQP